MSSAEFAGSHRLHLGELGAHHNPHRIQSRLSDGIITAPEAVELLEGASKFGLLYAAQLATEQAFSASNFDEASTWIQRAATDYDNVLTRYASSSESLGIQAEALLGKTQLPLMSYLACFGELPPQRLIEKCYQDTVTAAERMVEIFPGKNKVTTDSGHLVGIITEAAVLLLAQRFTLRQIGDNSWLALHSLYSQDNGNGRRYKVSTAWDMTVFTEGDQGPVGSYFVEIKASADSFRDRKRNRGFAEGITPVFFAPDLQIPGATGMAQLHTVKELAKELKGDPSVTSNLDRRTERLLDILG